MKFYDNHGNEYDTQLELLYHTCKNKLCKPTTDTNDYLDPVDNGSISEEELQTLFPSESVSDPEDDDELRDIEQLFEKQE
jgi:hypothetical protein